MNIPQNQSVIALVDAILLLPISEEEKLFKMASEVVKLTLAINGFTLESRPLGG